MTISTLYFGPLRERRGTSEETVTVPLGATVQQVFDLLFQGVPEAGLPVAFAVNHARVPRTHVVCDGDTVAFLPPVGGG